jgi:hypothetical protein
MNKQIKINCPNEHFNKLSIFVETALKYINQKDGMDIGYAKNHHTIVITLNDGKDYTIHTYETKTMIIIDIGV